MATPATQVANAAAAANQSLQKRVKIYNVLCLLRSLSTINVTQQFDCREINVTSDYQFLPNWQFLWAEDFGYYRGYIHIVRTKNALNKVNAGYSVCTLKSPLIASAFIAAFAFFFKNRAFKVT